VIVAGWACLALLSFGCKQPPPVDGNTSGQGGTTRAVDDASPDPGAGGSTGTSDASAFGAKLDVPPAWWGTADAMGPDEPSTPSVDSNCGKLTVKTTRPPVDVLLVLDRSGSMAWSITDDCYCSDPDTRYGSLCPDTTNCSTRWSAVSSALKTTLSTSSFVNWGLKFFPSAGAGQNCTVDAAMEVPISDTAAAAVQSAVDNVAWEYCTPTAAALNAATAYLKTLTDSNGKFILLATDGQPNCGGTRPSAGTTDLPGATQAAEGAYTAGFQVFVVGIGPSLDNLSQLAKAGSGGTTDYFQVSSPQDLAKALSSISKLVGSCNFKADQAPPDPNNVAVYVNGKRVDKDSNNGWTFGSDPQEIVLTGDYCSQMTSGNGADVQILFGCPGQPYFPPDIY
jgi:hypothetical protein